MAQKPNQAQGATKESGAQVRTVKVTAKNPPFVELHTGTRIGDAPVLLQWTPWIQAQINAGLLIEA